MDSLLILIQLEVFIQLNKKKQIMFRNFIIQFCFFKLQIDYFILDINHENF